MKFIYNYRDKNNIVHEDVCRAHDRDAVFRELKKRGIHPSRVIAAPGLFNKIIGSGKRWLAIAGLVIIVIILLADKNSPSQSSQLENMPRHQIYGDPALFEELSRSDYASVFENRGERFLARYAQPGSEVAEITKIESVDFDAIVKSLEGCVNKKIPMLESDVREIRELKQIVEGMKSELEIYLSDGIGTVRLYIQRLAERQESERDLLRRAKMLLQNETDMAIWKKVNDDLRRVGLRTIAPPEF